MLRVRLRYYKGKLDDVAVVAQGVRQPVVVHILFYSEQHTFRRKSGHIFFVSMLTCERAGASSSGINTPGMVSRLPRI